MTWLTRFLRTSDALARPPRARLELSSGEAVAYAIGDVHGCFDELLALEELIVADAATFGPRARLLVFLGDLIDRGPRSADVIDHLLSPPPPGFERIVLCGNHEAAMLSFLESPETNSVWMDYGGDETLRSYGVAVPTTVRRADLGRLAASAKASIPEEHLAFLRALPISVHWGKYLFVHAGLRPGVPFARQSDDDLVFIRDEFLDSDADHGSIVVHGHTPAPEPARFHGRIGIDTGAYATGRLSAVRIDGEDIGFITATAQRQRRRH